MKNIMTIDLEEWFHGFNLAEDEESRCEHRLRIGLDKLLHLFDKYKIKATFFVLGEVAKDCPDIIRSIKNSGHEVAFHGLSHKEVYNMSASAFDSEIKQGTRLLEDITGEKVYGFRAPVFSITKKSLWALDILEKNGIEYDSSIYPGPHYRYGIPGFRQDIHCVKEGGRLIEVPPSTGVFFGLRAGLGSAYFRILPYALAKSAINKINAGNRPAVLYFHPWEFDLSQPVIKNAQAMRLLTHYANLKGMLDKFSRLLKDFEFIGIHDYLEKGR